MSFNLIFERRFSMAHRLISGSSEKCSVPHGHNEYVKVFLSANENKNLDQNVNMIQLFEKAKEKWHFFIDNHIDHAFQVSDKDPLISFFKENEPKTYDRLVVTPGDPTTEIMCCCLMSKIQTFLENEKTNLSCVKIELLETPTNMVSLQGKYSYRSDLPDGDYWWNRNDYSINDLKQL